MNFVELAKKRYSCRNYQDRKVEKEKLEKVLDVARIAPTGGNRQPQRLIVIQEKEGINKLSKAANIYDVPLAILVCGDKDKVWTRPFDGKQLTDIDTSIVTDHMMLQATELGLASVWVCYFNPDIIREEFSLPDNLEPINILLMGYESKIPESPERHEKTRVPLSEIVSYETL